MTTAAEDSPGAQSRWKCPEWFFLVASALAGAVMILVTPPFQVADEYLHFYRAYAISEAHFLPKLTPQGPGDYLPSSIAAVVNPYLIVRFHPEEKVSLEEILRTAKIPLRPMKRELVPFKGAGVYSPVPYLPQALGIAIGRGLGGGALSLLYFGRIANVVVCSAVLFLAIRIAPLGRWVLAMLALMPMSDFQRASVSPDALTIAVCFLYIAFVLRMALLNRPLGTRELAIILCGTFIVLSCKPNFLPLLLLMIPMRMLRVPRHIVISAAAVLAITLGTLWWMSHLANRYFEPARPGTNAALQAAKIKAAPVRFVWIVYEDHCWEADRYYREFFGRLGWLDTSLSSFVAPLLCAVILILALLDGPRGLSFADWQRLIMLVVVIASTIALSAALYVSFTFPSSRFIDGLQGRYWIPFSPLIFLLARNGRFTLERLGWRVHMVAGAVFCLTLWDSAWRLLDRYYETMPWG